MSVVDEMYARRCNSLGDINEHLPTLRRYATECRRVTEFGVRDVWSTWALLAARPTRLVSYDIAPCPIEQAQQAAREVGIDFRFVVGDTLQIVIDPTEMLFIDTNHVYSHLKAELERHADKVSRFIALHDTTTYGNVGADGRTPGLWGAVEEFLAAHPEWKLRERFTNNNGLTVLARA